MVPLEADEKDTDDSSTTLTETTTIPPPSPIHRNKMIPLYTTAQSYPWYSTLSSLAMPIFQQKQSLLAGLSGNTQGQGRQLFSNNYKRGNSNSNSSNDNDNDDDSDNNGGEFRYRYAVYRAGVFHRWENAEDENFVGTSDPVTSQNTTSNSDAMELESSADAASNSNNSNSNTNTTSNTTSNINYHVLPLRFLIAGETYIVNDVLGKRKGQKPDIYHKKSLHGGNASYTGVAGSGAASLVHVPSTASVKSAGALASTSMSASGGALESLAEIDTTNKDTSRKKTVGFAPPPPSHSRKVPFAMGGGGRTGSGNGNGGGSNDNTSSANNSGVNRRGTGEAVQLNATDGLVVVSAFLPVVVHRDETSHTPKWTADWDYEALLSMQTHLRVTRVGVVKWKGWHGNYSYNNANNNTSNSNNSNNDSNSASDPNLDPEEYGVPINERYLVEECLRPFHCVPVWIDPLVFGEMYNGFCKGILWPVLHNSASVYASHAAKDDADALNQENNESAAQFSELCRDDVEQGPIHGGRGREKELWSAYTKVNHKFSEVVVQCFNEGDLVWIHGFHLLILPSYLTRRISMAKIGIFLHTPFPSSEIFRTLWCREDLLRGMLNADQVGFHLFEYARHFLTCCRRLLGLNYGMIPDASGNSGYTLAIDTNGRHVAVTSIHAGIEPPVLNQILQHRPVVQEANMIRQKHPGKTIFCSIDRLESLKGIPLKFLAMERFLKRCPEWVGKIVLIQVGITAWERGDDYIKTRNEVVEQVRRINAIWPGTIQFQEAPDWKMRLQQRMAIMKASDVMLVTPIRDGLNLIPLEFTIAHQDAPDRNGDPRRRGLVILSEFASCTRVMRGALHVNPWKISEIAQAFQQALTMSDEERKRRITCAKEFVTRVTTQRWALAVMLDLKGVHKSVNPVQYSGAGLGLGFRLLGMDVGFESLDFKAVAKAYKMSTNRLILFDYGGTITSNENLDNLSRFRMVKTRSHHSEPTPEMIQTIQDLCDDKKNTVFVVSGKERHSLIKTMGHIPNLGLAAEHGMYISWPERSGNSNANKSLTTSSSPHKKKKKRHWDTLVPISDRAWRALAMSIMEVYASRTHGSYIEETEMKVLWQYRDADLEFGYLQARELEDHLSNVLRSYAVDILHGGVEEGGYVEVRPKGVNKGVFAMKAITHYGKLVSNINSSGSSSSKGGGDMNSSNHNTMNASVDFALVLGDDHCDEPMLSVMRQIGHRVHGGNAAELPMTMRLVDVSLCDENVSSEAEIFTCTVGKKPSAASNYLQDVSEVEELLQALVKVSKNPNASKSMLDLMMEAPVLPPADFNLNALRPLSSSVSAYGGMMTGSKNHVSGSLGDFLGGIDDAEEEDMFF